MRVSVFDFRTCQAFPPSGAFFLYVANCFGVGPTKILLLLKQNLLPTKTIMNMQSNHKYAKQNKLECDPTHFQCQTNSAFFDKQKSLKPNKGQSPRQFSSPACLRWQVVNDHMLASDLALCVEEKCVNCAHIAADSCRPDQEHCQCFHQQPRQRG